MGRALNASVRRMGKAGMFDHTLFRVSARRAGGAGDDRTLTLRGNGLEHAVLDFTTMMLVRSFLAGTAYAHLLATLNDHDLLELAKSLTGFGHIGLQTGTPGPKTQTNQPAATDPEIEALNLTGLAKTGAYEVKRQFPDIKFTSGRRSLADQARAMAGNVAQNRLWIARTYAPSVASRACQKWVDDNPGKKTASEIETGLRLVLTALPGNQAGQISKHLTGEAFDVQPVTTKDADAIKAAIRKLKGVRFLDKEGGLVRWHAQF